MPVLNIRIIELMTKERRSGINYLYSFVHTGDSQNKMIKMKITTNKKGNVLLCEKQISFKIESQSGNFIYLDFKRHRMLISDDLLGKLVLPLDWFPTNHVVREWFPITNKAKGKEEAMILLDIHVDNRNVSPFMAPFSTMKVIPSWKRPTLTENAEVAANPPIVYTISPQSNCIIIPSPSSGRPLNNPYLPPHQKVYQQGQLSYYYAAPQSYSQPNIQLIPYQHQMNLTPTPQVCQYIEGNQVSVAQPPPVNPYREQAMDQNQQNNIQTYNSNNTSNPQQNQSNIARSQINDEKKEDNDQQDISHSTQNQAINDNQKQISQQIMDSDYNKINLSNPYQQPTFTFQKPKNNQTLHQSLLSDQQTPVYYPNIPQYPNFIDQN